MGARAQIEETMYRYAYGFDVDDIDLMVSAFSEDAELVTSRGNHRGRATLRDFYQARRDNRTAAGEQTRHVVTNLRIELESEDRARASSYYTLTVTGPDRTVVLGSVGTYDDELTRDGDGWLITRRHTQADDLA